MKKLLLFIFITSSLTVFSKNWYLNDGSRVGDVYCTAVGGANGGTGLTPDSPKLFSSTSYNTLKSLIASASFTPGDVIFMDALDFSIGSLGSDIIFNKALTLIGAGPTKTILKGPGGASTVKFGVISSSNVVFKNFKCSGWNGVSSGSASCLDIIANSSDISGIILDGFWFDQNLGSGGEGACNISSIGIGKITATIKNIFITCNNSGSYAGGFTIKGDGHRIDFLNCYFKNNQRNTNGGAINVMGFNSIDTKTTIVKIDRSNFLNNSTANGYGGAICVGGAKLIVSNSCFSDNSIGNNMNFGNAIAGIEFSRIQLSNCNFYSNTGSRAQVSLINLADPSIVGGLYELNIDKCSFDNSAISSTRCIYYKPTSGTFRVNNCTFTSSGAATQIYSGVAWSLTNSAITAGTNPVLGGTAPSTINTILPTSTPTPTCNGAISGDCSATIRTIDCTSDNLPPVIKAHDSTYVTNAACTFTIPTYTAIDICDPLSTVTSVPSAGTALASGTTTSVIITATDATGNSTSITVYLTTPACSSCFTLTSAGGTDNQSLCRNTSLTNITYSTKSDITGISNSGVAGANGLPPGVSATYNAGVITISGTPTESGDFNYNIPLIGGCGFVQAIGNITVSQSSANSNTVTVASNSPKICVGSLNSIDISHTTTGATGISTLVSNFGLPQGITASWSNNEIKIFGSATEKGVFNYTIPLTGGCGNINAIGTINVVEYPTITTFPEGYPNLSVCENTPMFKDIVFNTQGVIGLSNDVLNNNYGLPKGLKVNFSGNSTSGELKISGIPHEGFSSNGLPPYQVNIVLKSECEFVAGVIMQISVSTAPIAMEINSNINACLNSPVNIETHSVNGMFDISSSPILPQGLKVEKTNGNQIILSGVPEEIGIFDYYISLIDANSSSFSGCTMGGLAHGKITVSPLNTVSLNSNSITVCNNTLLTPIIHTTTGATGIGLATGLPAGVTASWLSNTLTISGSPTVSGAFNYSIPLIGGCGSLNATGTIIVTTSTSASPISGNTDICQGSTSQLTNATPGGVWSSSNTAIATVNSSGLVTAISEGVSTIKYDVTGNSSCSQSAEKPFRVIGLPVVNSVPDQQVCEGASFNPINFSGTAGATFNWSNSDTKIGLNANGSGNINAFIAKGTTLGGSAFTSYITVTPVIGNCIGNINILKLSVSPQENPSFSYNDDLFCKNQSDPIPTILGTKGGSFTAISSGLVVNSTSGVINLNASIPGNNHSVMYKTGGVCSKTSTASFVILSLPVVDSIPNYTICSGKFADSIKFKGTAGASFDWTNSNTTTGVLANGQNIIYPFDAINNGNSDVISQITVTPRLGKCFGPTKKFNISVRFVPRLIISQLDTSVCSGGTLNFKTELTPSSSNSIHQWFVNDLKVSGDSAYYSSNSLKNYDKLTVNVSGKDFCPTTSILFVRVNSLSLSMQLPSMLYVKAPAVNLVGYPNGGTFIGKGIVNNKLDPNIVGVGSKLVTYSFKNAKNCVGQITEKIIIYDTVPNNCHSITYDTITVTNYVTKYDTVKVSDTVSILKVKFKLTTGIKANQETTMRVYPNPTSDILRIEVADEKAMAGYAYKIIDAAGKEVYNQPVKAAVTEIPLKTLGAVGAYFLEVLDEKLKMVVSKKIILE